MNPAQALRLQIEHSLENRFPAALSPVPRTISELTGPESSGRTSLALAFLAGRTRESLVCAWVDAGDSLDPESAAASGVSLKQLLWVRCHAAAAAAKPWARLDQALRSTDLLLQAGGFSALVLDLGSTSPEHASRIPLATWFRFRQAADRTRCSLLVLGQAQFAQSSAAVMLRCTAQHDTLPHATVLNSLRYEVSSDRQRQPISITGPRKPPASTWTAASAWERLESRA